MRARLLEEIASCEHVVLDLTEVAALDRAGLATLLECLGAARARNRTFEVCGLAAQPRLVFRLLRLDGLFGVGDVAE